MTSVPHPRGRGVERPAVPQTQQPTMPTLPARHASRHEIHELVQRAIDEVEDRLGLRPDVQLDWPARTRVAASVAGAIGDAVAESLARVVDHDGTTSAFLTVSWREDTVEVCVVDDGSDAHAEHQEEATGVEHDVDDFGPVGTCQWWSIPTDLG
jgi:hypothetical protein